MSGESVRLSITCLGTPCAYLRAWFGSKVFSTGTGVRSRFQVHSQTSGRSTEPLHCLLVGPARSGDTSAQCVSRQQPPQHVIFSPCSAIRRHKSPSETPNYEYRKPTVLIQTTTAQYLAACWTGNNPLPLPLGHRCRHPHCLNLVYPPILRGPHQFPGCLERRGGRPRHRPRCERRCIGASV